VDAQNIAGRLADYYRDRPDVVAVYLFGSVARGTAGPRSDIDVGVIYLTAPQSRLLAEPFLDEANLAEQLERTVQIIVMNRASADLVHRVLRDGILVLDQHPSQRIAFEVQARNEYFDLLPTLRRYREGPRA
jgi:predicted nucleotidyltransferase